MENKPILGLSQKWKVSNKSFQEYEQLKNFYVNLCLKSDVEMKAKVTTKASCTNITMSQKPPGQLSQGLGNQLSGMSLNYNPEKIFSRKWSPCKAKMLSIFPFNCKFSKHQNYRQVRCLSIGLIKSSLFSWK